MGVEKLTSRIERTPGVLGGKARIAGRRISVQHIAALHDRGGWDADEIASEYDLTLAEIHAALSYYFEHREEIDAAAIEDEAFVETLRSSACRACAGPRTARAWRSSATTRMSTSRVRSSVLSESEALT